MCMIVRMCMQMCVGAYVYTRMWMCAHERMNVHVVTYVYVHVLACVHVHVYVCMCI